MREAVRGYTAACISSARTANELPAFAAELSAVRDLLVRSSDLAQALVDGGVSSQARAGVVEDLLAQGIVAGVPYSRLAPEAGMDDVLLLAVTETTTSEDIAALAAALKGRIG